MYRSLPKGKQTAYQRWEITSFEEEASEAPREKALAREEGAAEHATVTQATVEDMNNLVARFREEAQKQGFDAGHAEGLAKGRESAEAEVQHIREKAHEDGFAAGMAEGQAKGEKEGFGKGYAEGCVQAEADVSALKALLVAYAADMEKASEAVADELLALALDLSKALLKTALDVKPELILPIVRSAIHHLPSLQLPALLYLNPQDAQLVRTLMGSELEEAGWKVVEEPLERGGCRIETPVNQMDASVETRWQRLVASLGETENWTG
ncbi:MAG: flagellar assembly protein FliH [Burkholderiaceae bacterium]|jgi:flagellar assembly protein FliH|nr:flagellar assembly protein FliH [Burkholderiaceae bacterium]